MKSSYYLFLIAVLLAACSGAPSGDLVGTAISLTMTAQNVSIQSVAQDINTPEPTATNTLRPPATHPPTYTQRPTAAVTHRPTAPSTPKKSREEIKLEFAKLWADVIEENVSDVETVTMSRINNGRLEIELRTLWASQDSQANVSYEVVQVIAQVLIGSTMPPETAAEIVGGDEFTVYLVTYSTDGDYRYESTTNYDTLAQIKNRSISHDEWVTASNAGFR